MRHGSEDYLVKTQVPRVERNRRPGPCRQRVQANKGCVGRGASEGGNDPDLTQWRAVEGTRVVQPLSASQTDPSDSADIEYMYDLRARQGPTPSIVLLRAPPRLGHGYGLE